MRSLLVLGLLALPLAVAQTSPPAADNASVDELPVGTGLPGEEESTEGAPGWVFGAFVVVGTVAFAGVLLWGVHWQKREPPLS